MKKSKKTETILVVDDNYSIRKLISQQLQGYNIITAKDGEQGVEKALKETPDLILSDVMMPKKDGFELCKILKKHKATSHIPIILLTAKAEQESKIDGLKTKADDYIYKPYDLEKLQLKINNLIEGRRQLRETFNNLKEGSSPTSHPNEDKFILDLRALILSHLEDMKYGIADICKALKISRAQLHNKLKALTGLSTSKFILFTRLQKGKKLLESTLLNISEISFEIGIQDPN
jgi:CheY-like chemotaxis protein